MNAALAVKAFIVYENKLLLLKRSGYGPYEGVWELPGGRLTLGENPFEGLMREVREETCLEIVIKEPLTVKHFTRKDHQVITMLVFVCYPIDLGQFVLSSEHTAFQWLDLSSPHLLSNFFFEEDIRIYNKRYGMEG